MQDQFPDKFLEQYRVTKDGLEDEGFLRVFVNTTLFQRLALRDQFNEDLEEIKMFQDYCKNKDEFDRNYDSLPSED